MSAALHVILPAGVDDPARPSGGNRYDRRVCDGLRRLGWEVLEHHVPGRWPCPDQAALAAVSGIVARLADGDVVVVDGLVASACAEPLVPDAARLALVVLVHMPFAIAGEQDVLGAARAVVTTSVSARAQLLDMYALDPLAVHVVQPGVDRAAPAQGTSTGRNLLCVAPISHHKGQDTLLSALATVRDRPWRCRLVGSLERDPQFAARIRRQCSEAGLGDRVELCGVRSERELTRVYAAADLLVHPSRGETYGMVITEALARGVPVVATSVGGVPEALGVTPLGPPGVLVGPDDPLALGAALRSWLTDADTRRRLRCAAVQRSWSLPSWQTTAEQMAHVLGAVAQ